MILNKLMDKLMVKMQINSPKITNKITKIINKEGNQILKNRIEEAQPVAIQKNHQVKEQELIKLAPQLKHKQASEMDRQYLIWLLMITKTNELKGLIKVFKIL